jgi:hypothetical protein
MICAAHTSSHHVSANSQNEQHKDATATHSPPPPPPPWPRMRHTRCNSRGQAYLPPRGPAATPKIRLQGWETTTPGPRPSQHPVHQVCACPAHPPHRAAHPDSPGVRYGGKSRQPSDCALCLDVLQPRAVCSSRWDICTVGWDIHALLCQLFTRVERDSLRRPPLHTTSRCAAPAVAGALSPAVL